MIIHEAIFSVAYRANFYTRIDDKLTHTSHIALNLCKTRSDLVKTNALVCSILHKLEGTLSKKD